MQMDSVAFAGYRSFAARNPAFPGRPLQCVPLAPLTILLGKNNSGKSTVARLTQHILTALGSDEPDPFPMSGPKGLYGMSFRDVQHGNHFFNPLDLDISLVSESGNPHRVVAQIIQSSDLGLDTSPLLRKSLLDGQASETGRIRGLLPDISLSKSIRLEAQQLLNSSCYLGPVRFPMKSSYPVETSHKRILPESDELLAHMLYTDTELRADVGDWTAENLDGWRIDVKQNLDVFQIVAKRAGREVSISDSGQGLQQVLPVAVLCHWRKLQRRTVPFLDVIEQPELHLHDAAQAPLGDLLLAATDEKCRVIVETHSEALVLRVRRRIAEGLAPERVCILFIQDLGDHSTIRRIGLAG